MNLMNLQNLLLIATGDDSHPWLIAICLVVSIIVMILLFILGGRGNGSNRYKK